MSDSVNNPTRSQVSSPLELPARTWLNGLATPALLLDEDGRIRVVNERVVERYSNDVDGENWRGMQYPVWVESRVGGDTEALESAVKQLRDGASRREKVIVEGGDGSSTEETICLSLLEGDQERWILVEHGGPGSGRPDVDQLTRTELLNELHETTRSLMDAHTVEDVVTKATSIGAEYFDFVTVGIRLLEDGKLVMKTDQKRDERLKGRGMPPAYEPGEGFVGQAFKNGEPVVIDDLRSVSDGVDFDYSPMESAMLLPLGDHGIIGAASANKGAFDETDLELGRQFATDVKLALDRAKREKRLKETTVDRDYLRSVIDSVPGIFFTLDWDGRIQSTNMAFRDMVNLTPDEVRHTPIDELIEFDGSNSSPVGQLNAEGDSVETEATIEPDGQSSVSVYLFFDVLESRSVSGHEIICSGIDLTEQKRKNRQLREHQNQLSLALNAANAGIWVWNLRTGDEFWDENTERLFGLEPGEFGGQYEDFKKFVHPDDRDRLDEVSSRAIEEKGDFEQEFRIQTRDGERRWLLSRGEVFTDEEGEPERMIGVTMDITRRKLVEEDLQETAEEKDALLREVHHRVKNNMQIINSMLSMLCRRIDDDPMVKEINEVKERVRSMAIVHEHLYQSTSLSSVDIESYLETLCHALFETSGVGDRLSLDLSIEAPDLDFDIDQTIACGLIVNELLMNAIQHGYPDGEEGTIEVQLGRNGEDGYRLLVRDDGRGFGTNFDPREASSMGLKILDSLVNHELGGTTTFSGQKGATVEVTF